MNKTRVTLIMAALFSISLDSSAALFGRLAVTPGGIDYQAYYDDQLNVTWMADANVIDQVDWNTANNWATSLVVDGVTGWRLPNMDVNGDVVIVDCASSTQADCKDNEYGHLFYYGSGVTFDNGVSSLNPAPFNNVQASQYWSNISTATYSFCKPRPGRACMASAGSSYGGGGPYYAWAVHDGDIGNTFEVKRSAINAEQNKNFTYSFCYENINASAAIVQIITDIPAGTTFFSASGSYSTTTSSVIWSIGSVQVGGPRQCVDMVVQVQVAAGSVLVQNAMIQSDQPFLPNQISTTTAVIEPIPIVSPTPVEPTPVEPTPVAPIPDGGGGAFGLLELFVTLLFYVFRRSRMF